MKNYHELLSCRYLYVRLPDGFGYQFSVVIQLIRLAEKLNAQVLWDLRDWCYFKQWGETFEKTYIDEVFKLNHPRLIYSPNTIDEIISLERKTCSCGYPKKASLTQ